MYLEIQAHGVQYKFRSPPKDACSRCELVPQHCFLQDAIKTPPFWNCASNWREADWQGQLTVSPFHELAISSTCATRLLISHLPEHRLWTRQLVGNRLPVANVAQSNVFVSWHLDGRDGEFPMRPKEPALALQRRAFC